MNKSFIIIIMIPLFACSALAQDYSASGKYLAGWKEVTVTRPDNSTYQALLYYPAQTETQNAEINPQAAPCPGISFGHGYLVNPDKYRSTFAHLASWGYVLIATRSELRLFPSHQNLANDLSHCLTWLGEQSENTQSFLYQIIDCNELGVSGHSMGGGAGILAASVDSRIKAVANLAAAETDPSAITAMEFVDVPISLISGSDDGIVPVDSHGQLMYNNGYAPKQIPIIQGASHCGFMDSNILFCDSGSISRTEQLAITKHLLTAFFELHLKNKYDLWGWGWGPAMHNDSRWSIQQEICLSGDFNVDCCINLVDLQAFLMYWLQNSCSEPDWCSGRDFDRNQWVDLKDFVFISQGWLDCF